MKNLKIQEQIKIALENYFIITPDLGIPTAQIENNNGVITLRYNPKFLKDEKFREQVFAHEALHYLQGHISKVFNDEIIKNFKGYYFPKNSLDKIINHELINVVLDHNINKFLIEKMGLNDPNSVLLYNDKGETIEGSDTQNLALIVKEFEEAYEKELSQNKGEWVNPISIPIYFNKSSYDKKEGITFNRPENDGDDNDDNNSGIDTKEVTIPSFEISEDEEENSSLEEVLEEIKENIEAIKEAIDSQDKPQIGSNSKGGIEINFELQEELELELEDILIQGFEDIELQNKKMDTTVSRMGFFGKKKSRSSYINIICDISGSMTWDNQRMEMLGSTLASINKTYNLSFFDDGITEDDILVVSSRDIEDEIDTIGGGGTNLLPAIVVYEEEGLLNQYPTIIITDGELLDRDLNDSIKKLKESEKPFKLIVVNQDEQLLKNLEDKLQDNVITLLIK